MKKPTKPRQPAEPKKSYDISELLCSVSLEKYRKYTIKDLNTILTNAVSNVTNVALGDEFEFEFEGEHYEGYGIDVILYTIKNKVNLNYDLDLVKYKKDIASYKQQYAKYLLKLKEYKKKLAQEKDKAAEQKLVEKRKLFEKLKKELGQDV